MAFRPRRPAMTGADDPVRARRARIGRLARTAQRVGYGCLGAALALFVWGAATTFNTLRVDLVVLFLAAGSIVLLPAMIAGYGVRAADREERGGRTAQGPSGPPSGDH